MIFFVVKCLKPGTFSVDMVSVYSNDGHALPFLLCELSLFLCCFVLCDLLLNIRYIFHLLET